MIVLAGILAVGVACVALWLRMGGEGEKPATALSPGSTGEASAALEPPELLPLTPRESVVPIENPEDSIKGREEAAPAAAAVISPRDNWNKARRKINSKFGSHDNQITALSGIGADVVGPASATDNAIARYDLTTGKLLQNSGVTVGDGETSPYPVP